MLNSANAAKAICVVDAHLERAKPCCLAHGVEKVCPHLAIAWQWATHCFPSKDTALSIYLNHRT